MKKNRRIYQNLINAILFSILLIVFAYPYRARLVYRLLKLQDAIADHYAPCQSHNLKDFGIGLPGKYHVHGIDISHYQRDINWREVRMMKVGKDSISFVFIKATDGTWLIDTRFDNNWQKVRSAGLIRGAYHYFRPNQNPVNQADLFCSTVTLNKGDLPPLLDVEEDGGLSHEQLAAEVSQWLNAVESRLHVKPVIYTNIKFYRQYLYDSFKEYPLWIAHYYTPEPAVLLKGQWSFLAAFRSRISKRNHRPCRF